MGPDPSEGSSKLRDPRVSTCRRAKLRVFTACRNRRENASQWVTSARWRPPTTRWAGCRSGLGRMSTWNLPLRRNQVPARVEAARKAGALAQIAVRSNFLARISILSGGWLLRRTRSKMPR